MPADKLFIGSFTKENQRKALLKFQRNNIIDDHMEVYVNMKKQMLRLLLFITAVIGLVCYPEKKAYASATNEIQVVAVAYSDESIIVKNNGNTKIYFATEADAGRGNWDIIDVTTAELFTVIDFSYLSPNTDNILKIKGNLDSTPARIIIRKRPQKLEVSINYSNYDTKDTVGELLNIRSTEGYGDKPITIDDLEWKKGADGEWLSSTYLKTALLKRYLLKGTILYFRTAAYNDVADVSGVTGYTTAQFRQDVGGYSYKNSFGTLATSNESSLAFSDATLPDGTEGRRPGSEVRLKINKQDSTPVTNIDGGEFTMGIKYGQEYRISLDGGTTYYPTGGWIKVTDTMSKPIKLKDILYNTKAVTTSYADTVDGLTKQFPAMSVDVRDYATSRTASSKIVTTNIPTQRVIPSSAVEGTPSTADNNIYVNYNGNKNIIVTIPTATKDYPYEYTVVRSGNTLDLDRATWTEISKNTPVKIAATKAVDDSTIYFRKKEIKYQAQTSTRLQVNFQLASTYATYHVSYPSLPVAPKKTYVYTKGYSGDIEIVVQLNTVGRKPFEKHVKAVKLGTKDIPFTLVPDLPETTTLDPSVVNTLTIRLTGTELAKMANCTARTIAIYYDNGTVDKATSKLTIKNPTEAGTLLMNTPIAGSTSSTTLVNIASTIPSTNRLVYAYSTAEITGRKSEDTVDSSYTALDSTGIINTAGRAGQWLTIYEVTIPATPTDPSYIVRYKSVQLTAAMIAP